MTNPSTGLPEELEKCPYCGKVIETPVVRKIIDQAWNSATRKKYVRTQDKSFCSQDCGLHYQMGCEG